MKRSYGGYVQDPPPGRCPVGCKGIEIEPGRFSGCSCPEGKLPNGLAWPAGFKCDCPHHRPALGYDVGRIFGCLAVLGILIVGFLGTWGAIVWVTTQAVQKACRL